METKYKFFYGGTPFSNFYKADFIVDEVVTRTFKFVEQYMMFHKAMLFQDYDTAQKILESNTPGVVKRLGRQVKNYDDKIWSDVKYDVVKQGVKYKFEQNPNLLKTLKKYKGYQFVEAAANDRIWGIGYSEEDAMANINNWGQNLLGRILTELSDEL